MGDIQLSVYLLGQAVKKHSDRLHSVLALVVLEKLCNSFVPPPATELVSVLASDYQCGADPHRLAWRLHLTPAEPARTVVAVAAQTLSSQSATATLILFCAQRRPDGSVDSAL